MIFPVSTFLENLINEDLTVAARSVSERYRGAQKDKRVSSKTEALAYAAARMPATFGAIFKALSKTLELYGKNIDSVLDIGAGTGAATLAAQELLNAASYTCLEKETVMKDIGEKLVSAKWEKFDLNVSQIPYRADLVIAAYVLNELPDPITEALKLWNATGGLLLIVDSALPQTSAFMQKIRQTLTDKGAYLIAPCPHTDACNEWCHFATRIERTRLHRRLKGGEAPFEDEKFTFLAFSKTPVPNNSARILRHPQISSGKVGLTLCTQKGIQTRLITKKNKELYKKARKAKTGDTFPDVEN